MCLLVIGHMSLVTSPNVRIRTRHCAFVVRLRLGVDAPAGADRGTHRRARAGKIFRIARTRNGQRRSDGICKLVVAWDLRSVTNWDLASIAIQFLFAVSVYVICALVGPKAPDDGTIDLEDFFWRQRPYFYGALIVCLLLALLANLDFLKTPNAALFVKENLGTLAILVPTVVALISRNRVVQWAAGVCFLVIIIGFAIMFSSTLG